MSGVLLDTHVWLWYAAGAADKLARDRIQTLEKARRQGRLCISAISVWEVGILQQRNRIHLAAPLRSWIEQALAAPGIRFLPLGAEIALESTLLPGTPHGDPADRFLIAAARIERLTLATADSKILDYGAQGYVKTLAI